MSGDPAEWELLLDEAIAAVTGRAIPPDARFFEAGVTSAAVVEIHQRLRAHAGIEADVSAFFKYPTRRSLAAHLSQTCQPAAGAPSPQPAPQVWTASARRDLRGRLRPGMTA